MRVFAMDVAQFVIQFLFLLLASDVSLGSDLVGCGGFVQSDAPVNFSLVEVVLYTSSGVVKYRTDCAPNNGYFLIPLYDKGDFVLRVEPPKGWSFEPEAVELAIDGKTDPCSRGEDINFVFAGFSVNGRVISRGQREGPEGVQVTLSKADDESVVLNATVSGLAGVYTFNKLLPGKYLLKGLHRNWQLDPAVAEVVVSKGNAEVSKDLVVTGYDLRGQVESDGRPMKGVSLFVFGQPSVPVACKPAIAPEAIKAEVTLSGQCLCEALSDENGSFVVNNLPLGNYQLVPFFQNEHITFDVLPKQLEVNIGHDSVVLAEPFRIRGFTVTGRVLDSPDGQPVPGAMVIVDGNHKAMTDLKGQYRLEHVVAGTYNIEISKPHMFFSPEKVRISAMTPKLPDLVASAYSVCGKVTASVPGATSIEKRQVQLKGPGNKMEMTTCNADGEFCFRVAAGQWHLEPVITPADRQAGLLLYPMEHPVVVKNAPVRDIAFSQFLATVSAEVVCFAAPCSKLPISLQAVGRTDAKKTILRAQAVDKGLRARATFNQVLPGQYRLTILDDKWCWQEASVDINVAMETIPPVVYTQTGYMLKYLASHPLKLLYNHVESGTEGKKDAGLEKSQLKGTVDISNRSGSICLPQAGVYTLTTKSCHQFAGEPFSYDTQTPSVVSFTAAAHRVTGSVLAPTTGSELRVQVLKGGKKESLGPLESTKVKGEDGQPQHIYHYTYWAAAGDTLAIEPLMPDMLFRPQSHQLTVSADACPERIPVFHGRRGVYVEGSVTPPVAGVQVAVNMSGDKKILHTDATGKYRLGPIDSTIKYSVSAAIDGYVVELVEGSLTDFRLSKLAKIIINVRLADSTPLPGVLVSLSGRNFRSNNFTGESGMLQFSNLGPGQYFVRCLVKEYVFEPASRLIDVAEGAGVEVDIIGRRVSFSSYGTVHSLAGQAVGGVVVTARGLDNCSDTHEASTSEADGTFRLRGLPPYCHFLVEIHAQEGIERAVPGGLTVDIQNEDVRDMKLVVLHAQPSVVVSGYVESEARFLSSLRLQLFSDQGSDSALQTVNIGAQPFFFLSPLPAGSANYRLVLESSLPTSSFHHTKVEKIITSSPNTFNHHVILAFTPQSVSESTEVSGRSSSFLGLLLVTVLCIVLLNHQRLQAVGTSVMQRFSGEQPQRRR